MEDEALLGVSGNARSHGSKSGSLRRRALPSILLFIAFLFLLPFAMQLRDDVPQRIYSVVPGFFVQGDERTDLSEFDIVRSYDREDELRAERARSGRPMRTLASSISHGSTSDVASTIFSDQPRQASSIRSSSLSDMARGGIIAKRQRSARRCGTVIGRCCMETGR